MLMPVTMSKVRNREFQVAISHGFTKSHSRFTSAVLAHLEEHSTGDDNTQSNANPSANPIHSLLAASQQLAGHWSESERNVSNPHLHQLPKPSDTSTRNANEEIHQLRMIIEPSSLELGVIPLPTCLIPHSPS